MPAQVVFISAQDVRVLDNDHIRSHLNHEAAGILDAWSGSEKFGGPMKKHHQKIKARTMLPNIPDESDEVQRVGARAIFPRDRKFVFRRRQQAHSHPAAIPHYNSPGCGEIFPRPNRLHSLLRTNFKRVY